MGHSGQINKNIYSCRPVIKTMSLLSRIHKSLDMESAKSPSQTSSTDFNNSTTQLNFSTIKSLKRLRPVDSDSDCGESPTKTPRAKRTKWNPEDDAEINRYFKEYITPNGKKSAPSSDEIKSFLSNNAYLKTFGRKISLNYAKNLISRKIFNNRRILDQQRKQ